jgi:hypothetical protein
VTLETTELDVPNEGGDYTINFSSPIPLYLEPMEDGPSVIGPDTFWKDMYEGGETVDIVLDKKIEGQQLVLKIGKLKSRSAKVLTVNLYDCLNNVLGSVKITQQGDKNVALPRLGENSKYVVSAMALSLAEGFSRMNLIEQYYHYNKYASFVTQRVSPTNSEISDMWNSFYTVNNRNLMFKDTEADRLSIYQEYCGAFSALYYYYMVVVWGDVPYINDYDFYQGVNFNISRTSQNDIFDKLEKDLLARAKVSQLHYGKHHLHHVLADAQIANGKIHAKLDSKNELLDGVISVDALASTKKLQATLVADVRHANMYQLKITD